MPNVFGASASISTSKSYPLYDPRFERLSRQRFRRDDVPDLRYANSLYCPSGRWPARGWLLLRREDYDQINKFQTDLQLQIDDFINPPLTFGQLAIVQAQCISTGVSSDPDAIYLVEITDRRGVLWNRWFRYPLDHVYYNVRAPAYPEQFYTGSLNTAVAWTWNTLVERIWNDAAAFLGAYPGLPATPTGTPEGFCFPGIQQFETLCDVLDLIGQTVSVNLTALAPYGIAAIGAADAAFTATTNRYARLKEDDLEWIDIGSGRAPGVVNVLFHRRNQFYGTEETVRMDALQWQTNSYYSVNIAAPAPFTSCQGSHQIWDDFTVRYNEDGNPLAADVVTANAIAAQRVQQYYNRIYRGTLGFMKRRYAGAIPFATGSQVDGVCWRMNFPGGQRFSWQTEVVRGPQPPWSFVADRASV